MKWSSAVGYAFTILLTWVAVTHVVLFAAERNVAHGPGYWTAQYPFYIAVGAAFLGFGVLLRFLHS
jgi:hypothetical protein